MRPEPHPPAPDRNARPSAAAAAAAAAPRARQLPAAAAALASLAPAMVQTRRRLGSEDQSPAMADLEEPATPRQEARKARRAATTARKPARKPADKQRRTRAASEDLEAGGEGHRHEDATDAKTAKTAKKTRGLRKGPDAAAANGTSTTPPPRKRSLSNASGGTAATPAPAMNGTASKKRARSGSTNGTAGPSSAEHVAKQEFQVQRCRFVNWVPFAITSMSADPSGAQLALTRENGAIEVWNVRGKSWHQSLHVPGREEPGMAGTTLSIAWVGSDRLFGSDMDGNVFEVDMRRQARVRETSSFGGAVWCMDTSVETGKGDSGAEEAGSPAEHGVVAMGCEDGRVRIFEVLPGSGAGLEYARAFRSVATGRILALKYHPARDQRHILYTGGVDGLIRKWDARSGQVILQIATESYGKVEPICVWALAVLKDSTLFSGDSDGHVHVWDSRDEAGTLIRGFHEHRADVTTLAVSKDEKSLFASGIDSRVAMFHRIEATDGSGVHDWVYGYSHRPHSRDVRGLALVDNGRVLASGGNDTQICWYPVSSFTKARPTRLSPFLHRQLVHVAQQGSLLLTQHAHHVELWRPKTQNQLASLRFKGRLGLRCAALAPSGSLLVCADDAGPKVFAVGAGEADAAGLALQRLGGVEQAMLGVEAGISSRVDGAIVAVRVVTVGPKRDELVVYAFQSGRVCVARVLGKALAKAGARADVLEKAVTLEASWDPLWGGTAIKEVAASADGQWVAAVSVEGSIAVHEVASKKLQMEIPRATLGGALCSALCFQPGKGVPTLAVATMQNEVFVFDVKAQKLTPWSLAAAGRMDPNLLKQHESVIGLAFDPTDPTVMVLWGRAFACKVSLAEDPHALEAHETGTLHFSLLERFKPMMHMECVDEREMLVVEAPWIKVMQTFRDPIKRKVYGGAT